MSTYRDEPPSANDLAGRITQMARRARGGARRAVRRLSARLRSPSIPVIFHEGYRAPENPWSDPKRAERIVAYLRWTGAVGEAAIIAPDECSAESLVRSHSAEYLGRLDEADVRNRVFGIVASDLDGDAVIEQQRRMVAGTLLAARLAARATGRAERVVNLGGGLHHADRDGGGGFCLFNDVVVAIDQLRDAGFGGRILVIDLDLHQGDGTRRAFAGDPSVFTLSIHAERWDETELEDDRDVPLGPAVGDRQYLRAVEQHVPEVVGRFDPDLVFYVAGVDVAADDTIGNWRVSPDGVFARDQCVVEAVGERPMVWLLAGGYGPNAWRYSARSLSWLTIGDDRPIPSREELALSSFRRIASGLGSAELATESGDGLDIDLSGVLADLTGVAAGTSRLLGYYSRHGLEIALERYGIYDALRAQGITRTRLEMDLDHATGQLLRLVTDDTASDRLIELVLRRTREQPPGRLEEAWDGPLEFVSIEWLLLQNPRAVVDERRPLLPGQEHPGLGCLREIILMCLMASERLSLDGLLFHPGHYHVAAPASGWLRFVDPEVEARFLAIEGAVATLPLARASWAVHDGRVRDADSGEAVSWQALPMGLASDGPLRAYFESSAYEDAVAAAGRELSLVYVPPDDDDGTADVSGDIRAEVDLP